MGFSIHRQHRAGTASTAGTVLAIPLLIRLMMSRCGLYSRGRVTMQYKARRYYESPSRQLKNEGEKIFYALPSAVTVPLQNTCAVAYMHSCILPGWLRHPNKHQEWRVNRLDTLTWELSPYPVQHNRCSMCALVLHGSVAPVYVPHLQLQPVKWRF